MIVLERRLLLAYINTTAKAVFEISWKEADTFKIRKSVEVLPPLKNRNLSCHKNSLKSILPKFDLAFYAPSLEKIGLKSPLPDHNLGSASVNCKSRGLAKLSVFYLLEIRKYLCWEKTSGLYIVTESYPNF
ncbi:hypothetical protein TNCV_3850991 [Trichonephila clavipes]|nr:hypothetical protein TNCV_3850991 [Trichonephila clavipes]